MKSYLMAYDIRASRNLTAVDHRLFVGLIPMIAI